MVTSAAASSSARTEMSERRCGATLSNVGEKSTVRGATIKTDSRWRAIEHRDTKADGSFFYSVRTTGVYCYPSCPARLPRPENVAFHSTPEAAEAAGFRPCKRCKPREAPRERRRAALVESLCRMIEASEEELSLQQLADGVNLSPSYVQRTFKAVSGISPKQYWIARRREKMQSTLRDASTVTEAVYAAGFGSAARFYDESTSVLGMTPRNYRAGGSGKTITFAIASTSLGAVLVAATDRGVCSILLGDDPQELIRDLERRFPTAELAGAKPSFDRLVALVVGLVENPSEHKHIPLDIQGTAFQQRVWAALMQVPPGSTVSYAELAAKIGDPRAARAVARACASNPIALAVPCHRVVRQDGGVSGYRWGVERKRELLRREQKRVPSQ